MNPACPRLSAICLPLVHDEERYRSNPETKALCVPLQGLELTEAGCRVIRPVEDLTGDNIIPNKDSDLCTKEKKDASKTFNPFPEAMLFFALLF